MVEYYTEILLVYIELLFKKIGHGAGVGQSKDQLGSAWMGYFKFAAKNLAEIGRFGRNGLESA